MKSHGAENADVQPVEKRKVLCKRTGTQLIPIKQRVEYILSSKLSELETALAVVVLIGSKVVALGGAKVVALRGDTVLLMRDTVLLLVLPLFSSFNKNRSPQL